MDQRSEPVGIKLLVCTNVFMFFIIYNFTFFYTI
jgi:hypothetical protein